jgi:uracil-DNA glycosylase
MAETLTDPKWRQLLAPEFAKAYYKNIEKQVSPKIKGFLILIYKVAAQRDKGEVYPPTAEVYAQFNHCPLDKIRVVIIGQDPYFNPGQAEGLCFSVKKGVPIPPSLNRIYKVC